VSRTGDRDPALTPHPVPFCESLPEPYQAVVGALAGGKGLLTSEIAGIVGLTSRATHTRLTRLVRQQISARSRDETTGPETALLPGGVRGTGIAMPNRNNRAQELHKHGYPLYN
jgi:hypothetical protein